MMVDVSVVPMMHAPDLDPAGNELDETSWAALIDMLRPRLLALAPRELCNFCRESYYHDLLNLVISNPASETMLKRGGDLACGVFTRMDALLEQTLAKTASSKQLQQLSHLARQLAMLEDELFNIVLENLGGGYLDHLMKVSGGLEGDLAKRSQQHFDEKTWAYFAQKHQDWRDEPISQEQAAEVITELPIILTGQDWKSPTERWYASDEGQRQHLQYREERAQFQKRFYDALPWWQRLWRRITGRARCS